MRELFPIWVKSGLDSWTESIVAGRILDHVEFELIEVVEPPMVTDARSERADSGGQS